MPSYIFVPLLILSLALGQLGARVLEQQLDIYFPLPPQSRSK
jgi:hypothetical protein